MKFQTGDKVILLHSGEEAEIIDFISKDMATVEVNGVQFPVYIDQMDFPYFQRFSQKKKEVPKQKTYIDQIKPEKKSKNEAYNLGKGLWLSFLPVYDKDVFDDDIVEYFKLYLVNQSPEHFQFRYKLQIAGQTDFELKNEVLPFSDFYLHDLPFEQLNDSPRFDLDCSLNKPDRKKVEHFESSLKVKAKQVFQRIEETRLKQEASFAYLLFEAYPDKPENEPFDLDKLKNAGYRIYTQGERRHKTLESPRSVVDLHIEKLADQWKSLSNQEILDIQLATFEKFYDLAVQNELKQMIFIHGIGKGVLREEIHERLRFKTEVKSFVNQFHPLYGFGATEIFLK